MASNTSEEKIYLGDLGRDREVFIQWKQRFIFCPIESCLRVLPPQQHYLSSATQAGLAHTHSSVQTSGPEAILQVGLIQFYLSPEGESPANGDKPQWFSQSFVYLQSVKINWMLTKVFIHLCISWEHFIPRSERFETLGEYALFFRTTGREPWLVTN